MREALDRDAVRDAAERALGLYGAEVFGFVCGVLDDPSAARDVYASFAERVWRGLAGFRWHCSLRTWSYTIARNEIARHRARAVRRAARFTPLSDAGSLAADERSRTHTFERSSLRDALALLRSELSPEDREILVLRVDRELSWRDVALTFLGDAPEKEIERESARVRQRFVAIKRQLAKAIAAKGIRAGQGHRDGKLEAEGLDQRPSRRSSERPR